MKLIILDIVAIPAFLAYAQGPFLVSAASAAPMPALTASSTPIVAPVERRLRPSVISDSMGRALVGLFKAANGLADRVSQLFLGGASKAVGATFNGLARSYEKFRDFKMRRFRTQFSKDLNTFADPKVVRLAKVYLRASNSEENAAGRMYLKHLMERWKGKSLHDIIELVKPLKDVKELSLLVELDRWVETRKAEAQDKIKALEKRLSHPKPGDSQADLEAKIVAETKRAKESLMMELEDYYRDNTLLKLLYPSTGRKKDHLLARLYRHWKDKSYTAVEVEQMLRAIDPTVSKDEVARAIKAVDFVLGRLYVA
uniref:RxLR effector candidate protein n=1 Tax=Peronospora matthiolae TaxID=2874970 RepID=A0AAV1U1V5_9STRA